ncbi:MAG TPA: biotin carboxylase N-terminal domain-containing protein [Candidatus Limnocylindrales bacterium]|nr:biotin carboxylase N-terminal domain-containing protein [Candidatus Limnocylindrales bacterium]
MSEELSPSQVARRIGATTRSVQRWIAKGTLPARRVGGRWRVASDALDVFIATTTLAAVPAATGWSPVPIRHVFVANRGEIARRIQRTGDRLGVRVTVPPTSGPDALDLLDIGAVVGAALAAGADAVHPGFGFLAENADFARAVVSAGLRWVGPPHAAIRAMGDKAAARRLAVKLGVPVIPGYDGEAQTDSALVRAAGRIGYPILVKPAAGGGGKGMRVVRDRVTLRDALASARREATAAFGDPRLILERFVEGPRHVEVQVLYDGHGSGVHLGERDCSIQRRHQKVLEETPSPAVDPATRSLLGDAALRLAGAVGYASAGTCEFLLTDRGEVFFLEMNTRLQVEHPVTELVTGRDLVADQLRIAAGEPLGVTQGELDAARAAGGHAVEVRLYAEDAEAGFLPATGRVEALRWPSGPGIRVDAGIDAGDEVTGRFDPMLAKVIAHGADRAEAIDRLTEALDATTVLGLTTNLRFLRWLVREPAVRDGQARIDTLDRIWPPDDWTARTAIPPEAWAAAARALGAGGWRLNGPARARLVADDGSERAVEVDALAAVDEGIRRDVAVAGEIAHVDVAGRSVAFRLAPPPDVDRAARAAGSHHAGGPVEVDAPMPGSVLAVHVAVGASVDAGDPIATLEAMKMEHIVAAPFAGTVTEVGVRPADQVVRGQTLAVVEP